MEVISNPLVPFWSHIPGGVNTDTVIKIDGYIPHHFDRFSIDLMCGHDISHHSEHNSSIALHFNPRHYEQSVVLNSRHHHEWGHEDRKHHEWHAFHRGNNFIVTIHVEPEYYRINVNGNHFANFYHRIPFYEVHTLRIDGDVRINFIEYKRESYMSVGVPTVPYPTAPPIATYAPQPQPSYYPAVPAAPVYVPSAPYVPTQSYVATAPYVPIAEPYVPVVAPASTIVIEEGRHHHRPGFISSVIDDVLHPSHHHHNRHHW